MARRPSRARPPTPAAGRGVRPDPVVETGTDGGEYRVQKIPASRATKIYRCPGCDHEIRPGVAHVVVWPADRGSGGLDDRRHWHSPCWVKRADRGPTRRWS
ncbi:MAG: hypothetical protein U0R77_08130 [Mycolicibacterium insubricum]